MLLLLALLFAGLGIGQTLADSVAAAEKLYKDATPDSRRAAKAAFTAVLERSRAEANRGVEANALLRLGQLGLFLDEPKAALGHLGLAAARFRGLADPVSESRALNNAGVAHWLLGDGTKALETYERVLELRRLHKDRPGEGYTLLGIAGAHGSMGESAQALESYRAALAIWQELKDPNNEAETRNSMGTVFVDLADFDRGRGEFQTALDLWRKTGNRNRQGYALSNLGWVDIGRKQYQSAIASETAALSIFQATQDRRSESYAYHHMGSAHAALGDRTRALENFQKALELRRATGDRFAEAYTLQAIGDLTLNPALWQQALELRRDIPDHQGLIVTLGTFAHYHRDRGEPDRARAEIEEAIGLIESRRAALLGLDLRASYFASRRDYYAFHSALLLQQGHTAAALEAAERARGRQFLDRIAESSARIRSDARPELVARVREIERRLGAAAARAQSGRVPEAPALLAQLREAEEEIRRASPRYASLRRPESIPAKRMQEMLAPGEVLVQYLVGRDSAHAWLVTRNSITAHSLGKPDDIRAAIPPLRDALAARADWRPLAARLESLVFAPLARQIAALKPRRLIIAPDGPLEAAPFALIAPEYEIVLLPSASALALIRGSKAAPFPQALALLADPVLSADDPRAPNSAKRAGGSLARLRFSRIEAEQVSAIVPWRQKRLALDLDANRAFFSSNLRGFGYLHLATHALVDTRNPELSGIALSDGLLRLSEIYNLDLRAKLVTLSACRSATGAELPGEGLMSLTRGFLYAGASSVLATLWDVDDRASAELMKRFYRAHLVEGQPLAAALRSAQTSLRAEPGWSHPYYWAAFTIQGEWR